MQVRSETRTGLSTEIKIVPVWAWALAGIPFIAAQWFFNIAVARHANAPPAWARPLLGILLGVVAGSFVLFFGYINRDAKSRGTRPTLCTLIANLLPKRLGI